ncbi:hypothetical protein [Amycolatopsis sp. CA-126428]|uniref:hypothetical protein n=1 Tax=Amycolatopsis sp. CA-126428 TaxID=2073158 RepID=UPI000CCFE871|nr:hypothetical protein [Amycolatopsis sp. CA-126428]
MPSKDSDLPFKIEAARLAWDGAHGSVEGAITGAFDKLGATWSYAPNTDSASHINVTYAHRPMTVTIDAPDDREPDGKIAEWRRKFGAGPALGDTEGARYASLLDLSIEEIGAVAGKLAEARRTGNLDGVPEAADDLREALAGLVQLADLVVGG